MKLSLGLLMLVLVVGCGKDKIDPSADTPLSAEPYRRRTGGQLGTPFQQNRPFG